MGMLKKREEEEEEEEGMLKKREEEEEEGAKYMKGVQNLWISGVAKLPCKYILPLPERPQPPEKPNPRFKLPTVDLSLLRDRNGRPQALQSLSKACQEYGFFQVVNHGIPRESLARLMGCGRRFFEQSEEERVKYMSSDIMAPVRYGTSFNQLQDGVFYWRDFLKLSCHPLHSVLPFWPSSPLPLREEAMRYAGQSREVFLVLMEAILETLGLGLLGLKQEFEQGTHMLVINCFPPCPEPHLTLGMPPHSDYGFLTILLQDESVKGLQVQSGQDWVTIDPLPGSLFVNVGDHLEIFSNGRYKSVVHRVLANPSKCRNSIASLHSLPFDAVICPHPQIVTADKVRLYRDTDFSSFLSYMTSHDPQQKRFLECTKLPHRTS